MTITNGRYKRNRNAASQGLARKKLVKKRGEKCEECGSVTAIELHHIVRAVDGGTFAEDNLRLLCWLCHQKAHGHKPSEQGLRWHNSGWAQREKYPSLKTTQADGGVSKYLTTTEAAEILGICDQQIHVIAELNGVSAAGFIQEKGRQDKIVIWRSEDIARLRDAHQRRLELLAQAKSVEIEVAL